MHLMHLFIFIIYFYKCYNFVGQIPVGWNIEENVVVFISCCHFQTRKSLQWKPFFKLMVWNANMSPLSVD